MPDPQIPNSIDVWACPACGRRTLRKGNAHLHATSGPLVPVEPVLRRYVLAEVTDEMIIAIRDGLAEYGMEIVHVERDGSAPPVYSQAAYDGEEALREALVNALSTHQTPEEGR